MATTGRDVRNRAYGQATTLTAVDRLGVWLSARRIRRCAGSLAGKRVLDVGCGYQALLSRALAPDAAAVTLVDIHVSPEVRDLPAVAVVEGMLPGVLATLPDASVDVLICNSVLEHLWEPETALASFHRLLAPGGMALVNVPSWRGKRFLELAAFRLGVSPPDEMDDHKTYYDPRDLWPLLIRAGFRPRNVDCYTHKFGLNTFAFCRRPADDGVAA